MKSQVARFAAHAQGSSFDTGFNAIQSLFTGTIAKVASLVGRTGPTSVAHKRDRRVRRFSWSWKAAAS